MSEEATLEEFVDESKESKPSDGWAVRELSEVTDVTMGSSPKSKYYNEDGNGLPFFQSNNEFGKRHPQHDRWCSNPGKIAQSGDLLMTIRGTYVGQMNIADRESCIGRGLAGITPGERVNGEFLLQQLNNIEPYVKSIAIGSTFDSISSAEIDSLEVDIPPLSEQRKIATVLYTVDQAIQKSDEIESRTQCVKQGLVQDFLSQGLNDSSLQKKDTDLGTVPEHWDCVTIEEIIADEENAFTDGARYALSSDEIHEEGDARAILLEEVGEGEFNDSSPKFATQEKYDEITHRAIYPGEVVVAKMAEPVARACIVPDTYEQYLLGCADVVRIVPNEEVDDRFLMYCMNSHKLWKQAVAHLRGTGRSRINLENISDLKIPKPPLSEQREIVDILSEYDRRIKNERAYRDQLQRLKQGLMQDLLSGKVRTTDTNIEVPEHIRQHG